MVQTPSIGFNQVIIGLMIAIIFGASLMSIVKDASQWMGCGFCQEKFDVMINNFVTIIIGSQKEMSIGVSGVVTEMAKTSPDATLVEYWKYKVYTALIVTLSYIGLIYMIVSKFPLLVSNKTIPILPAAIVSLLIVGAIQWYFGGGFYGGIIDLISNYGIFIKDIVTVAG